MKIKTALITILVACSFWSFPVHAENFNVDIGANINIDLFSQVDVDPATVEIGQPSFVNIRILDSQNDPLENRSVEIFINGDDTYVTISQPNDTDSFGETSGSIVASQTGTYEVCVKDISEDDDIYIQDCESVFVIPVPIPDLNSEPQYTKGDTNTISWNHSGDGNYEYQVQVSNSSTFNTILRTTDWITSKSYLFDNLSNDQICFYRVRARNEYGGVSSWSGYEFSIQDNEKPVITLLEISGVEDNTIEVWDNLFRVYFKFKIEDNVDVQDQIFYCVTQEGVPVECSGQESSNGDIWSIGIRLGDLETDEDYHLYEEYTFCLEAVDFVGNVSRYCDISLTFDHYEEGEPPVVVPPPVQETKDKVEEIVEDIVNVVENIVGDLQPNDIQTITVTTSVTTIAIGLSALLTSLGSLPYTLLQMFLSILSFFGFRKKTISNGYVYDSVTKEPIPQAVVRVYDTNASLIWTDVTTREGYFSSKELEEGEYVISVTARNYTFPSKIVFGKEDFPLENVYHGDSFKIRGGKLPTLAIPMDSTDAKVTKSAWGIFKSIFKSIYMFLHFAIFFFGLVFALYSVMTLEYWWTYVLLVLYIPSTYLLIKNFLGLGYENKWGVVKDTANTVFEGVVIGLTDVEKGKLISKRVTDSEGKYRFVVGRGLYSLSVLNSDLKLITDVEDIEVKKLKGGRYVIAENLIVDDVDFDSLKKDSTEDILKPLEAL
jgi:hypothetical protein